MKTPRAETRAFVAVGCGRLSEVQDLPAALFGQTNATATARSVS